MGLHMFSFLLYNTSSFLVHMIEFCSAFNTTFPVLNPQEPSDLTVPSCDIVHPVYEPRHPETLMVVGMTRTGSLQAPDELDYALVLSTAIFCYSSFLYTFSI